MKFAAVISVTLAISFVFISCLLTAISNAFLVPSDGKDNDVCPAKYTPMSNFNPQRFSGLPGDHYPIWYIVAAYPPLPDVEQFTCLNINVQYDCCFGGGGQDVVDHHTEQQAYNFTQGSIFAHEQFLNFGFFNFKDGNESHWQHARNSWKPLPRDIVSVDVLDTDYINYAVMASCNKTMDLNNSPRQRAWVMGRYTDGMEPNMLNYAKLVLKNSGFVKINDTNLALVDNTGCKYWKDGQYNNGIL